MNKCVIGIDLGGTYIKAGLVTTKGEILESWHRPTEEKQGKEAVLNRLFELTSEILEAEVLKSKGYEVAAIGIGSPGVIDSKNGIVIRVPGNIKDWSNTHLVKEFKSKFFLPVILDNDANVFDLPLPVLPNIAI